MKRSTTRQFYRQYFSATKGECPWLAPPVCRTAAEKYWKI